LGASGLQEGLAWKPRKKDHGQPILAVEQGGFVSWFSFLKVWVDVVSLLS